MSSLLAIEWLKLKRYRTFWVLIGLFAFLLPFWNYEIAHGLLRFGSNDKNGMNLLNTAYSFPQVWGNLGFWASIFIMFISILVIILTTNEYTYRTNRQNIIDGWTRMQFFHAKVLLVLLLCAIITAYFFLLGMIFGGVSSGNLNGLFSEFKTVAYFFVLCLDYLGFALMLAIWIRRSGLAIGLFILYTLIIENAAKAIINSYTDLPYGNLMPLQASDELIPFPLMMMTKAIMGQTNKIADDTYLMVSLGWCAVYYFVCRVLLLKKDW